MSTLASSELLHLLTHPSQQDLITSAFDLVFVYSGIQNVKMLVKDKQVKGFDWRNMCLYASWNIWTLFVIYPSASLYLANAINFIYLSTQLAWLVLFVKYRRTEAANGNAP